MPTSPKFHDVGFSPNAKVTQSSSSSAMFSPAKTSYLRLPLQRCLSTRPTTTAPATAQEAISHLRAQPAHYVVASLVGHKYTLAARDLLTVARLKDVCVGDRLRLSEIHEVGSRDFTLRGDPILPSDVVKVEATVVEHTKGAMERIIKFKRRKHYRKTVEHKQPYTRLRIGPIELGQAGVL